jgi:hypothetical protein
MPGYSAKDLLEFLEQALDKGLGKKETLKTRIVSVGRIVDVVGGEEIGDLREADVDHIMERFMNLEGTKFSPGSLASYKSRLNSSIADFLRWKENPMTYRPKGQRASRSKLQPIEQQIIDDQDAKRQEQRVSVDPTKPPEARDDDLQVFPVPLRRGLTVKLVGLPHDLTQSEAQRIANVVRAMAIIEE